MVRGIGKRAAMMSRINSLEDTKMTLNMAMESSNGELAANIRVIIRMIRRKVMEKCIGLTEISIEVSGITAYSMDSA